MLGKHEQPAMLQQLINDYQLPDIEFNESDILVVTNQQGEPLDDARTEAEHQGHGRFYYPTPCNKKLKTLIRSCTASIAGGRKTMTFLLGYAMSLYARPNDTLSHVLVDEPYESSDFFYPTPYSKAIRTRIGTTEDAKEANVSLALIPFVRMRQELPSKLREGKATYTQAVAALNLAQQALYTNNK